MRGLSLGRCLGCLLQFLGWCRVGMRLQPVEEVGRFCAWLAAVKIARLSSFRTFNQLEI